MNARPTTDRRRWDDPDAEEDEGVSGRRFDPFGHSPPSPSPTGGRGVNGFLVITLWVVTVLLIAGVSWFFTSRYEPFTVPTVAPGTLEGEAQLEIAYLAQQVKDSRQAYDQMLQVVIGAISIVLVGVTVLVGYSWLANNRLSAEERAEIREARGRLERVEEKARADLRDATRRFVELELRQLALLFGGSEWEDGLDLVTTIAGSYNLGLARERQRQELLSGIRLALIYGPRAKPLPDRLLDRVANALQVIPSTDVAQRRRIETLIDDARGGEPEETEEDVVSAGRGGDE